MDTALVITVRATLTYSRLVSLWHRPSNMDPTFFRTSRSTRFATDADDDGDVQDDKGDGDDVDACGVDDADVDGDGVCFHQGHLTAHRYHTSHRSLLQILLPLGSFHFPRGLHVPVRFFFPPLSHFPVGPGVRVELRVSQD